MKKIIALFSIPAVLNFVLPVSAFAQEVAGNQSSQAFWNYSNPLVYLVLLAVSLSILTAYTVIRANAVLNELGYVAKGSSNSALKWTSENPTAVAIIIVLIVLTGLFLAV
jgi:heme/copper-type cytochrome/quinol oxidase subunit 2